MPSNRWTTLEVRRLVEGMHRLPSWDAVARYVGRSPDACQQYAQRNIGEPPRFNAARWTDEDDEYIRSIWPNGRVRMDMAAAYLGRGVDAVRKRAQHLGLPNRHTAIMNGKEGS